MTPKAQYYRKRGEALVKQMNRRQMDAFYFESASGAVEAIVGMMPERSSVSWGGVMTMGEIGLKKELQRANLELLDRDAAEGPEELKALYHKAFGCDYYIMSSNAITMDGKLVNIDGRGNRLAALLYGPENVIVIAGMNKVVLDEAAAVSRTRNTASPMNALRLERNTPCAKNGVCSDCQSSDCICSHLVVTRRSMQPGRIKVFLIGEELGY